LAGLIATDQQQDDAAGPDGVVNPHSGAEKETQLKKAGANLLKISKVSVFDAGKPGQDFLF